MAARKSLLGDLLTLITRWLSGRRPARGAVVPIYDESGDLIGANITETMTREEAARRHPGAVLPSRPYDTSPIWYNGRLVRLDGAGIGEAMTPVSSGRRPDRDRVRHHHENICYKMIPVQHCSACRAWAAAAGMEWPW